MRFPRWITSLAVASLILAQLAACTSTQTSKPNSRSISSGEAPLNGEQLRNLADLGIGILRLSILGNVVVRENHMNSEYVAKLAKIETERSKGVYGLGGGVITFGIFAAMFANMNLSFEESSSGGDDAIRGAERSTRVTNIVGGVIVVAGAALVAAESSGSGSVRKSSAKDVEDKAIVAKRVAIRAEFNDSIDSIKNIYASIFGLDTSQALVLRGKIQADIAAKAKSGHETITIDIPQVMLDSQLIEESEFIAFRANLTSIESAERLDAEMHAVLDSRNYERNLKQCKTILRTYVAWVKSVRPSITDPKDAEKTKKALESAERLLARI